MEIKSDFCVYKQKKKKMEAIFYFFPIFYTTSLLKTVKVKLVHHYQMSMSFWEAVISIVHNL